VDPKCLELSIYEGIPHLLVPPITTAKETAAALDWACEEMDERYRLLASFGVRNIAGYNEQLKNPTLPRSAEKVAEKDADGNPRYKPMPYIVIVVDEFADLMMVSGKEIETSIARLAQKARAAGIHIILATQRPSTNVITGVIKANFPTRLAFRVFSVVDSRTILDSKGAEALLGMGDSLFLPPNTGILQRVHGAYVSDDEVQSVVSFLSQQRAPEYNLDITTPKEEPGFEDDPSVSRASKDVKFDEVYDQALEVVLSSGQPTASYLQRRLDIGFNRAARILEQLEREGVVSAPIGPKKKREILIGHV
jgi:S-DNA-T family DNA segregation ATPase FtsK/SpoIIIE